MSSTKDGLKVFCALALSMTASIFFATGTNAESHKELTGVVSKALIKATPEEVFDAIRSYRKSDAEKRTVVEEKKGHSIIKEKFPAVPVLGDVDCTYEETEVPYSRIDYQMISSNKLKIFEGNWQLTPVGDGKSTLVKLTSYVDSEANLPAKDFLQHLSTHQDIHKRMSFVKKLAEEEAAGAGKKS
jgi:hypothetical protein